MKTILAIWDYFSWQTKAIAFVLVAASALFGFWSWSKNQQKIEAEKQLNQWLENQAIKDAEQVREQKEAVSRAESETNKIRNANFNNLSDEELKRQIIEKARKIK
jgi:hypothetical protein